MLKLGIPDMVPENVLLVIDPSKTIYVAKRGFSVKLYFHKDNVY